MGDYGYHPEADLADATQGIATAQFYIAQAEQAKARAMRNKNLIAEESNLINRSNKISDIITKLVVSGIDIKTAAKMANEIYHEAKMYSQITCTCTNIVCAYLDQHSGIIRCCSCGQGRAIYKP